LLNPYINTQYNADLVIVFNANYLITNDDDISSISIIRKINDNNNPNNGRPIVVLLNYNVRFLEVYLNGASEEGKKKKFYLLDSCMNFFIFLDLKNQSLMKKEY
jgi:hypothetical protein